MIVMDTYRRQYFMIQLMYGQCPLFLYIKQSDPVHLDIYDSLINTSLFLLIITKISTNMCSDVHAV